MVLTRKEIRKRLISLAKRQQRPGTGSSLTFLARRTTMAQFPDLQPVLGPVQWAVVGAAATRLYMPERVTQDLDIVIRSRDAKEVRQRLESEGFSYQGELSIGGSHWLSRDQKHLDVIECSEEWIDQALEEARTNRDAQGLPVLPLPYLVLMKFKSGRVQDLADATRMLGQADARMLDSTRRLFARTAPGDLEDVESLITLGQLEMKE